MIIQRSESSKAIGVALVKAQAAMHAPAKDAVNPAFKTSASGGKYATLTSVIDAVRGPLTDNGIVFMQAPGTMNETGFLPIETLFLHGESGEWISFTFAIPVPKRDPQGFGSATTYGCRYSLMAALGLAPADDDGEAARVPNGNGARRPDPVAREPFGLEDTPEQEDSRNRYLAQCRDYILNPVRTEAEVRNWWAGEAQARRDFGLTQTEVNLLKSVIAERFKKETAA